MEETTIYKLKYLILPDFIYEDKGLSGLQIKIASFIYTFKGSEFYFSNKNLGDMFNVSEVSVSNAIGGLEKEGYISLKYKTKSNGGQIRYVTRLKDSFKSDIKTPLSQTQRPLYGNDSKIKVSKTKDNIYASLEFLEKIPEQDLEKFKSDFNLSDVVVKFQGQKAADWCRSKGRRQKDYKAFFRNWLRNYGEFNKDKAPNKQFQAENTSKYDKYIKS